MNVKTSRRGFLRGAGMAAGAVVAAPAIMQLAKSVPIIEASAPVSVAPVVGVSSGYALRTFASDAFVHTLCAKEVRMDGLTRVVVEVPVGVKERFMRACKLQGRSMVYVLMNFMEKFANKSGL